MSDINRIAAWNYANGRDPIDYAVEIVGVQIEAVNTIRAARAHTPTAYAIFKFSLDDKATARRIIGHLLDAGWTPPHDADQLDITDLP